MGCLVVVVSDTAFLVVDLDMLVSALLVVVFDVLVVTAVVVVVSNDAPALEVVSAAFGVVRLTAEVIAVDSSSTLFSVVPQAVSMADNMMISIAFFIAISSFQQHHTTKPAPLSSLFGNFYLLDCLHSEYFSILHRYNWVGVRLIKLLSFRLFLIGSVLHLDLCFS